MLKPQWCLDKAKRMRHLIVPSVDTQHWLDELKTRGWLEAGLGILTQEDGMKAIPITDSAPISTAQFWQGLPQIDIAREQNSVKNWTDLLDGDLYQKFKDYWPRAYEIIGDILIVKIEPEVHDYREDIAKAMLDRIPNVRLVCADNGVSGKFRVRDLSPVSSRDGSVGTLTKIRENGHNILIDPAKAYFSSRLSNERLGNLDSAIELAHQLNRKITICDPYAGVGPSLANLLWEDGLVDCVLAGDLNPEAVDLLEQNIDNYVRKRPNEINCTVKCQDARLWAKESEYQHTVDFLLVNLPHQTIEHIEDLLPLIKRKKPSLIRGWAIIDRDDLPRVKEKLSNLFLHHGATNLQLTCQEIKGFSATKVFIRIESSQTFV
jgi:tRNA G37 N-methylase Trm5